MVTGGG